MLERRLFLCLSVFVISALFTLGGVLVYIQQGGAANFQFLGQHFSSSSIGFAVLFLGCVLFVYVLRQFLLLPEGGDHSEPYAYALPEGAAISWAEVIEGIHSLSLQLTASNGFRPDLIIGICGGGLLVADILSKRLGQIPCISIWAERHARESHAIFAGRSNTINKIALDEIISSNAIKRILLIDDVVYSGGTLKAAVAYLKDCSAAIKHDRVDLRTAALFVLARATFKPDYSIYSHSSDRKMAPASDRLRR